MTQVSEDPEYKGPGKVSYKKKGPGVELRQFTAHTEEEVDSPTFSPTPPPLRTLPPKARIDPDEPPTIVQRPKKIELASPSQKQAPVRQAPSPLSDSKQDLISKKAESVAGLENPAFENDTSSAGKASVAKVAKTAAKITDADDIYEEYETEYENTNKTDAPVPQGVFADENNSADIDDLNTYEEPLSLVDNSRFSSTQDFVNRQTSISGLPTTAAKRSSSAEEPLKVSKLVFFQNRASSRVHVLNLHLF